MLIRDGEFGSAVRISLPANNWLAALDERHNFFLNTGIPKLGLSSLIWFANTLLNQGLDTVMTQTPCLYYLFLIGRIACTSTLISLVLSVGMPGLAEFRTPPRNSSPPLGGSFTTGGGRVHSTPDGGRAYNPPSDARPTQGDHTGGGVRGCGEGDIAAIAPRLSRIGQTATQRPTFTWYVFSEDDTDKLEFHLYRYQSDNSLETVFIDKEVGPSSQGYTAYELPADQADLAVGATYLWQVVSYCDPNLEEIGTWSSADLEVVPAPADLDLTTAETSLQRAQAYAGAGLWYDAIAAIHDATTPEEVAFRQLLLEELAELEAQAEAEPAAQAEDDTDDTIFKPSEQLKQILQEVP